MDYYVCSTSVFDNIHLRGEKIINNIPGGAGIYALAGAKLWVDNIKLVCGVGSDYYEKMNDWFKKNNLSMNCLRVEEAKTPVNDVYYDTEEERMETPEFGIDHYHIFETKPDEFLALVNKENTGIYVFRNTQKSFWEDFNKLNSKKAFILWEIAEDACHPNEINNIQIILEKIDVFSLNLEEAQKLFHTNNYNKIIKRLHKFDVPLIFLRQGKKGQLFLKDGQEFFIPSIESDLVVDVTGGGNSSSGAVLVGASEYKDIKTLGRMANESAIMSLSQLGVPGKIKNKA